MAEQIYVLDDNYKNPDVKIDVWIKYKIGDLDPVAIFVSPEQTYVSFNQVSSQTQIFENTKFGFNEFTHEINPKISLSTRVGLEDVDLKIYLIPEENYMVFYSVTKSKKIYGLNIEQSLSPAIKITKELLEYRVDE